MYRLLGMLTGAAVSLITGYVRAQKQVVRRERPRTRLGICDHRCQKEYHTEWNELEHHDPRSPKFLSSLERAWFEDLEPAEATGTSPALMENVMFGHASLLLDNLVVRGIMDAHGSEHLKDYYRAMIFRTIVQQ